MDKQRKLCTPRLLPPAKGKKIIASSSFSSCFPAKKIHTPSSSNLLSAKEKLEVFKATRGEEAWRDVATKLDVSPSPSQVSKAYFKMREMLLTCPIKEPSTSFCMCEAPGGFAKAILDEFPSCEKVFVSSRRRKGDMSFSREVKSDPKICILDEKEGEGDILLPSVRKNLSTQLEGKCDLVTADGAVDVENRFEETEACNLLLLLSQVEVCLSVQRDGGSFVLKLFSCNLEVTRQVVFYLCSLYSEVYLLKPEMSRPSNDERYLFCTGYKSSSSPPFPPLLSCQEVSHISSVLSPESEPSFSSWRTFSDRLFDEQNERQASSILSNLYLCSSSHHTSHKVRRVGHL